MKLEFTTNEACYHKARMLKRLMSLIEIYELEAHFDQDLVDELNRELSRFMNQPEFSHLRDEDLEDIIRAKPTTLKDWLRSVFGPSRQEINLSKQREALIERAEHAENSAFEALAELADAAKEKDQALARVHELESELASLRRDPAPDG